MTLRLALSSLVSGLFVGLAACSESLPLPPGGAGGLGGTGGAGAAGGTGGETGGTGGSGGAEPDAAEPLFAGSAVQRIDVALSDADVLSLGAAPYTYVKADVTVTVDGVAHSLPDTGLRIKGQYGSFRTLDQKAAFLLNFHKFEKQSLLGLEKLAVNNMVQDPSAIHERLAYDLFRDMGVPAPRAAWADVYVNGELFGLYSLVEPPDNPAFLQRWFDSDEGNLYEGSYGTDLFIGPHATFDQDNGDDVAFDDLLELALALDAMSEDDDPPGRYAKLSALFDMDEYVRFAATEIYVGHWDGYANWRNNYFLYRRPSDLRWSFLPWGTDQTFAEHLPLWGYFGRVHELCLSSLPCRMAMGAAYEEAAMRSAALDLAGEAGPLQAMLWDHLEADPRKEHDLAAAEAVRDQTIDFLLTRPGDLAAQIGCADPSTLDADGDGASGCGFDCDDQNPAIGPDAPELCNLADENCNGVWDDDPTCPQCSLAPHPAGGTLAFCFSARSWENAEAHCVEQGGHLASIHDEAERIAIVEGAYAIAGGDWWIGLGDGVAEGEFAWTDGTPVDFVAWAGGEPNNAGDEDCAHFAEWAGTLWNDAVCANLMPYVCRLP